MSKGKLGEMLVSQGLIKADQLRVAVAEAQKNKARLGTTLVRLGHVNEKVLATFLSRQYGISAISLDDVDVNPELAKLVSRNLCERHVLVPVGVENNRLSIAISDPTNVTAVDDVRFMCNMDVNIFIAAESSIKALIDRIYGAAAGAELDKVIEKEGEDSSLSSVEIGVQKGAAEIEDDQVGEKPIIRLINKLFLEAIRRKTSDIHIEPYEQFSRVRFRIDGALHEIMRLPVQVKNAVPARIKVMSQLDISEKRLPQDGRIQVRTKTGKIDIRVSILPTIFGEKVVMRLLDQGNTTPDLAKMGFEEEQLKVFQRAASQPYGMLLVTGPTGSGKSTTLYAALSSLNAIDVNISTVEDPVEYNMIGINQVQMKDSIGLNFAAALRSLLRQDPDIVMVGEIRDHETAEIAIKAALTGHMVFSTLHTNDAPSTVSRLLHMGIEPFLITASLLLVQAQRLIRINCEHCREPDAKVSREDLLAAEVPENWLEGFTPMRGRGCDKCGKTGYKGRRGIYEVMYFNERLRNLIVKGANADDLKAAAVEEGMITLRRSGIMKMYRGDTTLEEVLNNSRPDGDFKKV
ncbi:MAG: type IV-A pilus assembly ATPase PilB [Deltaproteobacteria bacterium]|nr:type IV-A pilus assembly ATPase PilB [Deltaproteobacteria bacterium]